MLSGSPAVAHGEPHARGLRSRAKRRESGDLAELRPEQLAVDRFLLAHERVRLVLGNRPEELAHHFDALTPRRATEEIVVDRRRSAPLRNTSHDRM